MEQQAGAWDACGMDMNDGEGKAIGKIDVYILH
jgi:hypothetical protein